MEWFKRASGVKIFGAIWLLVALVPLWRLRAARQWENDQINSPNMEMQLGFSPEKAREAARRFPDEAAAQLNEILPRLYQISPNTYSSDQSLSVEEQSKQARQKVSEAFGRYAALSQRFPHSNLVRAQWLRDATRGALAVENDELVATYQMPNSPKQSRNPNWISREQLEKVIQVAQSGARQEPDNAFWPWMEAVFQFSLRRDAAALQALQKAGKCARFDDGVNQTVRERIALMHHVQTADFDDDLFEMWSALFPHLGRLRSATRAAMWQAKLALERGDTVRALQIADIVQRASAPMARSRGILVTRLVGEAQCYTVWQQTVVYAGSKAQKFTGEVDSAQREAERHATVEKFATYARRNERADLGQSALQLQASFNTAKLSKIQQNPDSDGLQQANASSARFHWLSSWLLRLSVAGAVMWVVGLLMSRGAASLPSQRAATLLSAAFCMGVTVAILWGASRLGAANMSSIFSNGSDAQPPNFSTLLVLIIPAVWLVPLIWTLFRYSFACLRFNGHPQTTKRRWLIHLVMDMAALGSFVIVFATLSNPPDTTTGSQLWPAPLLVFTSLFLGACFLHFQRAPTSLRTGVLLEEGALVCWMLWGYLNAYSRDGATDITIASIRDQTTDCVLIAALLLALLGTVSWSRAVVWNNFTRPSVLSGLALKIRLSAATLALCSSVTYLGVALWVVPVRHHAQQILDSQLTQGEVAFIESQQAKNN